MQASHATGSNTRRVAPFNGIAIIITGAVEVDDGRSVERRTRERRPPASRVIATPSPLLLPLRGCTDCAEQRDTVLVVGSVHDGRTATLKRIDGKDGYIKYAGGSERDIVPLQVGYRAPT